MKKFKSIIALVLSVLMLICAAGCSFKNNTDYGEYSDGIILSKTYTSSKSSNKGNGKNSQKVTNSTEFEEKSGSSNAGDKIRIEMSLKNYGFSAAFNLKSGFAILDGNNNVVSSVVDGDPTGWHSTSPINYSDRTQLTHSVTGSVRLPEQDGVYKIAFFLKNKLGQSARLDNTVDFINGYNILHTFTIY